ncbi:MULTISPECIES: anti-sigma factor antagonist [Rhodococcus]|uniref:Anti-sigma factor antagonist n=1 Tax=Rhodococcus cerastii TaxID=908616 RepID=A0ABU4CU29_9NOCA|nr:MULTISPECIES: anti-sigma factor antagonist [Rhodococcus]MDV6300960.1 anti-sigma factor antagonist [Rhodococcus cerastii]MDV8053645.1 anti-sigma factor antagonist [Rhodococcus sp. IEGM 1343]MDV8075305.1 anti-sigma factor antagonist [Rhodococcus sp. IEGM 1370]
MLTSTATMERSLRDDEGVFRLETVVRPDRRNTLRAFGELDMSTRAEFVHSLDRLASASVQVTVDLSEVSFMYSGVANAIIDFTFVHPGKIAVFAPARSVRMVLEVLGAGDLFVDTFRS